MSSTHTIILLLFSYFCYANGKSASDLTENFTHGRKNFRAADPQVEVTDINEYPFIASIQRAPGRQAIGVNAVFVTASWVLTMSYVIEAITVGTKREKHVVVISSTTNARYNGTVHRVKKIVYDDTIAVLKVHGEIHPFSPLVRLRNKPTITDPLTLLIWDSSLEKFYKITNVNILPDTDCTPGYMCSDSIPLNSYLDVCSPLLNAQNELVGIVYAVSTPVEIYVDISALSYKIKLLIKRN